MSARAAIHAMFQLDEAATRELDARLDAFLAEARPPFRRRHRRVSHAAVAAELRLTPGVWGTVGDYTSTSAQSMASHVQTAFLSAYAPAGTFEARTELTEDGIRVEARYVGDATAPAICKEVRP